MPTNPDIPDENYRNLAVAVIRNGLRERGYMWLRTHEASVWCWMIQIDPEYLERKCIEMGAPPRVRVVVSLGGHFLKHIPMDEEGNSIEGKVGSRWSRFIREDELDDEAS